MNEVTPIEGPPSDPEVGTADGRKPWDWETKYPPRARRRMRWEAAYLFGCLIVFGLFSALVGAYALPEVIYQMLCSTTAEANSAGAQICWDFTFQKTWFICYFLGGLGGTTFSIKWLMHSVGTGKWHEDRLYWRIFVPLIAGIYSVVIHSMSSSGLVSPRAGDGSLASIVSLSFLVGYFSDGVSGVLTNVANAVFGTVVEKKKD